jgi:hypothetical protein
MHPSSALGKLGMVCVPKHLQSDLFNPNLRVPKFDYLKQQSVSTPIDLVSHSLIQSCAWKLETVAKVLRIKDAPPDSILRLTKLARCRLYCVFKLKHLKVLNFRKVSVKVRAHGCLPAPLIRWLVKL